MCICHVTQVPKGGEECELCKVIVSYLDLAVNKNSTEKEIETAVEDFCRLIKSTKVRMEHFIRNTACIHV